MVQVGRRTELRGYVPDAEPAGPLFELSPWLDWLVEPHHEVLGRLAAQRHRRFVKTYTLLDGIPIDPDVTFIVVARHPPSPQPCRCTTTATTWIVPW